MNSPSSVFSFIPLKLNRNGVEKSIIGKDIQLFGFFKGDSYFSNMREVLNWGWNYIDALQYVDFSNYKVVRAMAPYMCYQQIRTHSQLNAVSHSARYTESDLGYWMPEEYLPFQKKHGYMEPQESWNDFVQNNTPAMLKAFMKHTLGINRREVYARGSDMLQYRVFSLGGYTNNENAWPHFIRQRAYDPHTQLETRLLCEMISDTIGVK